MPSNENMLTYSKTFKRIHQLKVLGAISQQKGTISIYGASAFKIPNEDLGLSGIDEGTPQTVESSISDWVLRSYLSRINYSYKSKLLFTASFRADASSKFQKEHRWGYFPSFALAYRLNNEPFIKKLKAVSDMKLRTSYGHTGNNRVSDFAYLSSVRIFTDNSYSFGNQTPSKGSIVNVLGNPLLKWETTKQFDAGIDLVLWNGRFTFNGDLYHKITDDLLLNAQLPNSSGYLRAFKNVGSVSNRGIELTFNSVNIQSKNFTWDTNFNISFNRSKVEKLTDNQTELTSSVTVSGATNNAVYIARIGEPVAQFYGLIYEGTYKKNDFIEQSDGKLVLKDELPANGYARDQIRPGDAKYKDISGDNNITNLDYTTIGCPEPDFIGGFSNNFKYKSFDLSVFFQFSCGNDVFNANKVLFENGRSIDVTTNQYASLANRWTEDNPDSNIPAVNRLGGNFYSSRSVEDGSYLRLKTLSLGYSLPSHWLNMVHVKTLRVYGSVQNLLTITQYSGVSPDVSTRHSALTPGFDISPYPAVRTVTFGLNVTF
jgi:TonB-linked SusC/RagA family outer membrane protein